MVKISFVGSLTYLLPHSFRHYCIDYYCKYRCSGDYIDARALIGRGLARYSHLARGDYSRNAKFQNSCFGEVINPIEENSIAKGTKDATEFGGTLFERKI